MKMLCYAEVGKRHAWHRVKSCCKRKATCFGMNQYYCTFHGKRFGVLRPNAKLAD